jgi:hypothetical protein
MLTKASSYFFLGTQAFIDLANFESKNKRSIQSPSYRYAKYERHVLKGEQKNSRLSVLLFLCYYLV